MKFVNLAINNIRKIDIIEMELGDSGLVPIKGKNRQGKTSVLDSFHALLVGKSITADMVSHGKKKGSVEGILQDGDDLYEVKRVIKPGGGNTIKVIKNGDSVVMKPQAFLDTLVNKLTFNPRPFMNKSDELKLKFMMNLLDIDFTEIDSKIKDFSDERTLTTRAIKKAGKLTHMEPVERVSVTKLIIKKNEISAANAAKKKVYDDAVAAEDNRIAQQEQDLKDGVHALNEFNEMSVRHEREMAEIIARHKREKDASTVKRDAIARSIEAHTPRKDIPVPDYEPTDDIDMQIMAAGKHNDLASSYERYLANKNDIERLENEHADLTVKINDLRKKKKEILAAHKMPIDGLEIIIDDEVRPDGLYFRGIYSDEWSDSEGMSISLALCVAMKPKLNALFIDKGESFDREGLEMLHQFAVDNGIQMIITIVESDVPNAIPDGEIWIEEGHMVTG